MPQQTLNTEYNGWEMARSLTFMMLLHEYPPLIPQPHLGQMSLRLPHPSSNIAPLLCREDIGFVQTGCQKLQEAGLSLARQQTSEKSRPFGPQMPLSPHCEISSRDGLIHETLADTQSPDP